MTPQSENRINFDNEADFEKLFRDTEETCEVI